MSLMFHKVQNKIFDVLGHLKLIRYSSEIRSGSKVKTTFEYGDKTIRHLIKNSFDIIGLVGPDGISHYVSESCEKILGYKPHELTGVQVVEKFVHPDDLPQAWEGMRRIIENKSGGMQYRYRHKNGDWVYLEAYGTNQLENPDIRSFVLNVRDITDRKKAEIALQESEKRLQEINATKDRFFSIIGHDLKGPLGSIMGISDVLIELIRQKDYTKLEEYAMAVRDASERTTILLENLLKWANTQTGTISFKPQKLVLNELVDRVIQLFDSAARKKEISIVCEIPDNCSFEGDLYMVNSVLRNLVSNGIKFSKQGGKIIISAEKQEDLIVISVKDSGVGIPDADVDKLFRIDYHYSTMGTAEESGTGLGLLLCREFVQKHGGDIWAKSKVNEGSRFSFSLPLNILSE